MKKNVVWWPAIVNKEHKDKYGDYDYFQYSKKTWEYWCKKNDCIFIPFEVPVEKDLKKFRVNWQKILFVFDELERKNIDYDQICLVDSSFMIRWDTPNFFGMTDRKFTACRDMDNMRWIYESIQGYKNIFNGFDLDQSKYVNSGFMIFNEGHKELLIKFKQFYIDNIDEFIRLQDVVVKKGNEQTPMNYWLQVNSVDLNLDLPLPYKLTHLQRKELFSYNWQLDEDKTPFFIKYGYNYSFNGMPKDQRTDLMKQTWDLIKKNYSNNILDRVSHKDTAKYTTSRKFKQDILDYFGRDFKDKKLLELGCCQGDSTRVYTECFKDVIGVDIDDWNIEQAKNKCIDVNNITLVNLDIYSENWNFDKDIDVVVIDAGHTYQCVINDINKVLEYFNSPIIIIDDYGNPNQDIKKAIDEAVDKEIIKIVKYIGEFPGYKTKAGWVMNDREGVICNVK